MMRAFQAVGLVVLATAIPIGCAALGRPAASAPDATAADATFFVKGVT